MHDWKLQVCCKFSTNEPTVVCLHLFAMSTTCTYLYSSISIPHTGEEIESILSVKVSNRNGRFFAILRIFGLTICK